jgi:hypothetical protein
MNRHHNKILLLFSNKKECPSQSIPVSAVLLNIHTHALQHEEDRFCSRHHEMRFSRDQQKNSRVVDHPKKAVTTSQLFELINLPLEFACGVPLPEKKSVRNLTK